MHVVLRETLMSRNFPLAERWRGLRMACDSLGPRVRMWRMVLNIINYGAVKWTPYEDPVLQAIVRGDVAVSYPSWGLVCPLLCFTIVE
ncbi:hypothetical protein PIB30_070655 [Stylosanthes scabra]|uniref:Uncharacterized protein n=1 Tax=Stylosanthes scabra TaxID=79078 RepID=A0ABU6RNY1_9FABA|nr:hypothetical protein [Stylosanthes scabra]